MPIDTQRAWLTEDTYDRARIELARLLMERATGSHREHMDDERRGRRIGQLRRLLASAVVGYEPPDDGIAEPGMVLTVRYEADGLTERLLMADREQACDNGLAICSPHSPLGRALCGPTRVRVASSPCRGGRDGGHSGERRPLPQRRPPGHAMTGLPSGAAVRERPAGVVASHRRVIGPRWCRSTRLPIDGLVLGRVVPSRQREDGVHPAQLVAMQRAEAGQDPLAVPGEQHPHGARVRRMGRVPPAAGPGRG